MQETLTDLAATARVTGAVSSSAIQRLRQGTEKRLGLEVSIEDPALRDLFGHLLQVEALLGQLRQQALALLDAANTLAEGPTSTWQAGLIKGSVSIRGASRGSLVGIGMATSSSSSGAKQGPEKLAADLASFAEQVACEGVPSPTGTLDAGLAKKVGDLCWQTYSLSPNAGERGSTRYRLERRTSEEVTFTIDAQLEKHERLRNQIRSRQRWRDAVEQCQHEVVVLRKANRSATSFMPVRTGQMVLRDSALRIEAWEEKLQQAQAKVSAIDSDILGELLELKANARAIVAKPFAAFARIRAEFFASLAVAWAPLAADLGADNNRLRAGSSNGHLQQLAPQQQPQEQQQPQQQPQEQQQEQRQEQQQDASATQQQEEQQQQHASATEPEARPKVRFATINPFGDQPDLVEPHIELDDETNPFELEQSGAQGTKIGEDKDTLRSEEERHPESMVGEGLLHGQSRTELVSELAACQVDLEQQQQQQQQLDLSPASADAHAEVSQVEWVFDVAQSGDDSMLSDVKPGEESMLSEPSFARESSEGFEDMAETADVVLDTSVAEGGEEQVGEAPQVEDVSRSKDDDDHHHDDT
ncbi:unnamed protein product [Polarella glacialis]|uniref:Uncharacterized protein n=1 Tax=Polarella glacialis TaxID=89957 RepID=A0A813EGT7_POLGL|nr:unnamed protein product [Polarella glacialis]